MITTINEFRKINEGSDYNYGQFHAELSELIQKYKYKLEIEEIDDVYNDVMSTINESKNINENTQDAQLNAVVTEYVENYPVEAQQLVSNNISSFRNTKLPTTLLISYIKQLIIYNEISINSLTNGDINKDKLLKKEPCQHKKLKVEFMGGGFLHTCKDCGEVVNVPRKEEEVKSNGYEYWKSGWNKGYGPNK